jgi:hypothetical protein
MFDDEEDGLSDDMSDDEAIDDADEGLDEVDFGALTTDEDEYGEGDDDEEDTRPMQRQASRKAGGWN